MALESQVRSKIVRQELDLANAGPSFALYEAKVKYLPENIEKEDFFNLCYGMLKIGDEISIYTRKKDTFEVFYKFLVVGVDKEAKKVTTTLIKKYDLMNTEANVEVEGVDPEVLNKAVEAMVDAKVKKLVETINKLQEDFTKYTTETDDQLEEIENTIETLTTTEAEAEEAGE